MLIGYINTMALLEPLQLIMPMIHGLYTFIRSDALANKRVFFFVFLFLKRHSSPPPQSSFYINAKQPKKGNQATKILAMMWWIHLILEQKSNFCLLCWLFVAAFLFCASVLQKGPDPLGIISTHANLVPFLTMPPRQKLFPEKSTAVSIFVSFTSRVAIYPWFSPFPDKTVFWIRSMLPSTCAPDPSW